MSNNKKVIPLLIGTSLLLTIIPSSFGYAKGSIGALLKGEENYNSLENNIKIEKVSNEPQSNLGKRTILDRDENRNNSRITEEDAKNISKHVLEKFCKIQILDSTPIKVEEYGEDFKVFVESNGTNKVSIDKFGKITGIYIPRNKKSFSKNYDISVDKSKKLIEEFLTEYFSSEKENIQITLSKDSNTPNNQMKFSLKRVHNNIDVVGEGGSITVDVSDSQILSYDMRYSSMSFEKEIGRGMTKKEAISILETSKIANHKYIWNGNKYVLDFNMKDGEEYIIDVNNNKIKGLVSDEYTFKSNINAFTKEVNKPSKNNIEKTSVDIIKKLTGKKGRLLNTTNINENGRSLIRTIVETSKDERYYIEYDAKVFNIINVYKYGYDTREKGEFKAIEFKNAYKKAVSAIGLLYSDKIKDINPYQNEYNLGQSRVYDFTFYRMYNDIILDDQYISVNIDAITGEVLSIFIQWKEDRKFEASNERIINEKRREYLNSLKGDYVYINENGIGKLYYVMSSKQK